VPAARATSCPAALLHTTTLRQQLAGNQLCCLGCGLGLLLLHLAQVELQLAALQDVAVAAPALPGAAGHARKQAAHAELVGQRLVDLLVAARALLHLALHVVGALQWDIRMIGGGVGSAIAVCK